LEAKQSRLSCKGGAEMKNGILPDLPAPSSVASFNQDRSLGWVFGVAFTINLQRKPNKLLHATRVNARA
jgi:hypothetical protein